MRNAARTLTDTNKMLDLLLTLPKAGLSIAGGVAGAGLGAMTDSEGCECQP